VSHARLTVLEPGLFELDVFEMAAPIQNPAKCEVRSIKRFLNAKCEHPAEIHKQIVAVYEHLAGKKFDDDDEVQEEVMTWFKGQTADFYDSGIQKLVPRLNKCLENAGDFVDNYVQAIHSQCRFCKLKMLYMFKSFVSLLSRHASYFLYLNVPKTEESN
jgi:hypothetical protein